MQSHITPHDAFTGCWQFRATHAIFLMEWEPQERNLNRQRGSSRSIALLAYNLADVQQFMGCTRGDGKPSDRLSQTKLWDTECVSMDGFSSHNARGTQQKPSDVHTTTECWPTSILCARAHTWLRLSTLLEQPRWTAAGARLHTPSTPLESASAASAASVPSASASAASSSPPPPAHVSMLRAPYCPWHEHARHHRNNTAS